MPLYKDKENNPVSVEFSRIPRFIEFLDNVFIIYPTNPATDLG